MGEALRLFWISIAQVVRIVDSSSHGGSDAGELAVQQRQLGIDAGNHSLESGTAGDPKRHTFGEHQVQDPVMQAGSRQRDRDRSLDRRRENLPGHLLLGRYLDSDHVDRRDASLADVVFADPDRRVARLVDHNGDVLGRLRVEGAAAANGSQAQRRPLQAPPEFHCHLLGIRIASTAGAVALSSGWTGETSRRQTFGGSIADFCPFCADLLGIRLVLQVRGLPSPHRPLSDQFPHQKAKK